jgi:hypothetical protein
MIVIGRYRLYIDEAKRLHADVFNLPPQQWALLTPDQQWALNKEFLDKAIAANDQIWLATPPEKVPLGSALEKELNYLATRGWFPKWVDDHWEVVRS